FIWMRIVFRTYSYVKSSLFSNFFFSSRRRHTRSKRDWSSDVCSSDLDVSKIRIRGLAEAGDKQAQMLMKVFERHGKMINTILIRSEERRVGKECRSRWAAEHEKERRGREE